MSERFTTGISRLDDILGGGLLPNAITLVVGAPGSGKTILAEQCLFANATPERPALYLATVSEPLDKLLRYGQSLEFFDPEQVGRSVLFDDLGSALHDDGLPGTLERIDRLVKEHHPGLVIIDSFKALKAFAADDAGFRRFLHDLAGPFTALAISSLWVGEYSAEDAIDSPEFAVADAVISLATKRTAERSSRYLTVLKLRGSQFASGDHAYRLSSAGLTVFPRLADQHDDTPYAVGHERVSTGIPALDQALGDGYWPGSATLVAGPSGAGKTLMGLHFLYAGATRGEPGILLTLQESWTQLSWIIQGFGWSIDHDDISVMDRSPVDLQIDELVYELLALIETTGARRVVIDSLGDLMLAAPDELRFREFVYSLIRRCASARISLLLTLESPELFRISRLSELGMSHLADNVVLLQHTRDGSTMKRALIVLKTRGSTHEADVREFQITADGIVLGDPLDLQSF